MKKSLLVCAFTMAFFSVSMGQARPDHEIHAAMLYNFIKYVQWPNESEAGTFVVGVMGEDDVYKTLMEWYDGKPKGSKKYTIKKLTSASEAANCQVVYLGKSKSRDFENIKGSISGKSVLTITDGNGLGEKGSCINFKVVGGKLKFELNQASVNEASLKISSQLASMAIMI